MQELCRHCHPVMLGKHDVQLSCVDTGRLYTYVSVACPAVTLQEKQPARNFPGDDSEFDHASLSSRQHATPQPSCQNSTRANALCLPARSCTRAKTEPEAAMAVATQPGHRETYCMHRCSGTFIDLCMAGCIILLPALATPSSCRQKHVQEMHSGNVSCSCQWCVCSKLAKQRTCTAAKVSWAVTHKQWLQPCNNANIIQGESIRETTTNAV